MHQGVFRLLEKSCYKHNWMFRLISEIEGHSSGVRTSKKGLLYTRTPRNLFRDFIITESRH